MKIILFGSRGRGDNHLTSDVDMGNEDLAFLESEAYHAGDGAGSVGSQRSRIKYRVP